MAFKTLAIVFTVLSLFSMLLFMLASLPLLVLKHDTPMDARFVRGLFNLYYVALATAASAASMGYLMLGNYMFCAGMAALALVALMGRRTILRSMDTVRSEMSPGDKPRIARFRKLHMGGMALNAAQLVVTMFSLRALAI